MGAFTQVQRTKKFKTQVNMKFKGLFTAMVTPFDSKGNLDLKGLRENFRYQIQNKVDGVVILGSTGETPTLKTDEIKAIIQIGIEEVKGKATIMVGTGTYCTEKTIENTKQAEEMGADAALIVTPYYNRPTQEGLYRHFEAISRATSIPICVYNVPIRTGQNLQTETLKRLSLLPSIMGIKEASGNIMQINDVIEVLRQHDIAVLSGDDALTLPLMTLGGHGIISVVSNLIPGPMAQFVRSIVTGDLETARNWHYQLQPLFRAAFIETNPIPIKMAMKLCNMPAGDCRLPLCEMQSANIQKIKDILNLLPSPWLGEYGKKKFAHR